MVNRQLLIEVEPIIASALHPEKNDHLDLQSLARFAHIPVTVTCKRGHERTKRLDGIHLNKDGTDINCKECWVKFDSFKIIPEMTEQLQGEYLFYPKGISRISSDYGIGDNTVRSHVKNVMSHRDSEFTFESKMKNHYAFDEINEKSAYWIGMLMADGNVSYEKNKSGRVTLGQGGEENFNEIYRFKEFLEYEGEPVRGLTKEGKPKISITVSSTKITNKLISYGVTPNKSLTAKVSPELINNRHFWRGLICGDGGVYIEKNKPKIQINGTQEVCQQFKGYCLSIVPEIKANILPNHSIWKFGFHSTFAYDVIKKLFEDTHYGLDRKVKLAHKIINEYKNMNQHVLRSEKKEEIRDMLLNGFKRIEISRRLNIDRHTVSRYAKKWGL
tara:strand:+ start:486 stop:1646 length:1161 start_codon:yes stop_codon:yes gene_type:complete